MPAITVANNNTIANWLATDPSAAPTIWAKAVELGEQEENFLEDMEAPGEDSIIQTVTDLDKDAGEKIHFRTMEGLYGEGVMGDELVGDNAEQFVNGGYDLMVDYVRHATEWNKRLETKLALIDELKKGVPTQLGQWMGRRYTETALMTWREKGSSRNYSFAGGKGSREQLRSADIIKVDDITNNGQVMRTAGGQSPRVGTRKKGVLKSFITLALGEGLTNLRTSAEYKQLARDAGVRGDENYIFKGDFFPIDGHVLKPYDPVDHAGKGPIGSPMMAKAWLGGAITSGDAAVTFLGGGRADFGADPKVKFWKHYSNYAYRWNPTDILAVSAQERYLMVINPPNSLVDPGKCGFYAYTVNNGNAITVTKRLRAAANTANGNVAYTTVGNVTWEAGAWQKGANSFAGCTDQHPIGALVLECNSYGVPFQRFFMLAAQALKRGYGKYRNKRTEETHEGGFLMKTYIMSVFGQALKLRTDGVSAGYVCVEAAVRPAGMNIPFVV